MWRKWGGEKKQGVVSVEKSRVWLVRSARCNMRREKGWEGAKRRENRLKRARKRSVYAVERGVDMCRREKCGDVPTREESCDSVKKKAAATLGSDSLK